jgi:predicted RNase H-like nuclease (RuvC/YqgF family)
MKRFRVNSRLKEKCRNMKDTENLPVERSKRITELEANVKILMSQLNKAMIENEDMEKKCDDLNQRLFEAHANLTEVEYCGNEAQAK